MPECAKELFEIQRKLEEYFKDMRDIEFTISKANCGLQTRAGKRTGTAMVRIAIDMFHQGYIDEKTAIKRCDPEKLNELLHPVFDEEALKKHPFSPMGCPWHHPEPQQDKSSFIPKMQKDGTKEAKSNSLPYRNFSEDSGE